MSALAAPSAAPPSAVADGWLRIYGLCLERAFGELRLAPGDAERWANREADRLLGFANRQ